MSWYSDKERFNEYDPPYCKNCKRGFTKKECDRCVADHEKEEKERKEYEDGRNTI